MPSIEIICVGQDEPTDFRRMPFAVESERELRSHRESSLFQADVDQLKGCIYHLGSPHLRDPAHPGAYTASGLLTQWWDTLRFDAEFVPHIQRLIEELLAASPEGRLMFTSDYQFGPYRRRYRRPLTPETFWRRHDARRLNANALYPIVRPRSFAKAGR